MSFQKRSTNVIFGLVSVGIIGVGCIVAQSSVHAQTAKKAMTWAITKTQVVNGKTYVLVHSDTTTNAYTGDTSVSARRSLLCIHKNPKLYADPIKLDPRETKTPGGAITKTWSGSKIMVIPNVLGSSLVSRVDADKKCNDVGQMIHGVAGFRMAEHHDGDASKPNAGWGFWAEGHSVMEGLDNPTPSTSARYWVGINDQNANPW
jgi:hypothetical protein